MAMGTVYILIVFVLLVAILIRANEPAMKLVKMALAWLAIFAAGFVLFTFRDDFGYVFSRLQSEITGDPVNVDGEIRIPMAVDGHFWIKADVNGTPVQFLVDSGATITTMGAQTARKSGVERASQADQIVQTANGPVAVYRGRAQRLAVGPIVRENFRIHVADREDLNVLGMNFLTSLDRWSVEGRWLILQP
jgi:aspartyl protease family protein